MTAEQKFSQTGKQVQFCALHPPTGQNISVCVCALAQRMQIDHMADKNYRNRTCYGFKAPGGCRVSLAVFVVVVRGPFAPFNSYQD
jgi:hypothetical protein